MVNETFATGHSLVHQIDPRVKILTAIFFSFLVAFSERFPTLIISLGFTLALIILANLSIRLVAKRMLIVNSMIFFCWLVLPFTVKGDPLFLLGPFEINKMGVILAARLTLKSNAILMALIALTATSPVSTLGYAMDSLLFPKKLVYLLLLTYRYLFVLEQEYQKLITAAKVRCFRPGNNIHTYKTYAYLVGMLLVRSSLKGERVHLAMQCRGFKGKFYSLHEFSISFSDWIWMLFFVATLVGLGMVEWAGML